MIVFAGNASLEGEGVGGNRGDCGVVDRVGGWEGGGVVSEVEPQGTNGQV